MMSPTASRGVPRLSSTWPASCRELSSVSGTTPVAPSFSNSSECVMSQARTKMGIDGQRSRVASTAREAAAKLSSVMTTAPAWSAPTRSSTSGLAASP